MIRNATSPWRVRTSSRVLSRSRVQDSQSRPAANAPESAPAKAATVMINLPFFRSTRASLDQGGVELAQAGGAGLGVAAAAA